MWNIRLCQLCNSWQFQEQTKRSSVQKVFTEISSITAKAWLEFIQLYHCSYYRWIQKKSIYLQHASQKHIDLLKNCQFLKARKQVQKSVDTIKNPLSERLSPIQVAKKVLQKFRKKQPIQIFQFIGKFGSILFCPTPPPPPPSVFSTFPVIYYLMLYSTLRCKKMARAPGGVKI